MSAKTDLDAYHKGMMENNVTLCLAIERRYGLDGYPPNVVSIALQAEADGRNMYEAIDDMMGC